MLIQEVARQSGITVRTLRYYDEIGLLKPDGMTSAGYRVYEEAALARLQQILGYREMGFGLDEIQRLLDQRQAFDRQVIEQQLQLMRLQKERLERIIHLLERQLEGEKVVSVKEFNYDEIKEHQDKYQAEVEEKYGKTEAYRESNRRTKGYDKADWARIQAEQTEIYQALAEIRHGDPTSPQAQALVEDWQAFISRNFYPCTKEILQGLGQMYQADDRFRENMDQYGDGLTDFLSKAIEHYCKID